MKKFLNTALAALVNGIYTVPQNSSLVVANEGKWAYNASTFVLEFTADAGFAGTATPLTQAQIDSILMPSTQYIIPTGSGLFNLAVTTEPGVNGAIGVGLLASGVSSVQVQGIVDAAIQAALSSYATMEELEGVQQDAVNRINQTNGNLQSLSGLVNVLKLNQHTTRFIKAGTDPAETSYFLDVACTTEPDAATEANFTSFKLYATENGEYDVNGVTVTLAKGDIVVISPLGAELLRQDTSRLTAAETALAGINTQIAALSAVSKWTNGSIVQVGYVQAKLDAILFDGVKGVYAIAVRGNGIEGTTDVITSPSSSITPNWDPNYTVRDGSQIELEIDENGQVIAFFVDNDRGTFALIVSLSNTITALQETVNELSGDFQKLNDVFQAFRTQMLQSVETLNNSVAKTTELAKELARREKQFTFNLAAEYVATTYSLIDIASQALGDLHLIDPNEQTSTYYGLTNYRIVTSFKGEGSTVLSDCNFANSLEGEEVSTLVKRDDVFEFQIIWDSNAGQWKIKPYSCVYYPNLSATQASVEALAARIDANAFN